MLHHFPVIIMRFIIDLRYNQIPIKPENRFVPAFADRLHRIVVNMGSGIPRFLLHFNNALQKTGRESRQPYLIFRTQHCTTDQCIGKTEQQVACLQLIRPVVDIQLDTPFCTDSNKETVQPDRIITIRNPVQTVDYRKIIVYIIKDMLTLLKVFYIYCHNVLFFHNLSFFTFCKVGK